MYYKGSIAKWNDERGFGFISPSDGGNSVFVHVSSFARGDRRPSVNEEVSYTLAYDANGRPQAKNVRFIVGAHSPSPMRQLPRSGIAVPIALAIEFSRCVSRTRGLRTARDKLAGALLWGEPYHVWRLRRGQKGRSECRQANA